MLFLAANQEALLSGVISCLREPVDRKLSSSLFSSLTKRSIVPEETVKPQRLQEFLDSAGQFERVLQDSGFIVLRRIMNDELTGSKDVVGLLEMILIEEACKAIAKEGMAEYIR